MLARTFVTCAALTGALTAQTARDRGPTVAIPIVVTVTSTTPNPAGPGLASASTFYSKKAGFDAVDVRSAVTPTVPPFAPDFSFSAMFGGAAIEVDAFSIGADVINARCDGVVEFTENNWVALLFAVEDGTGAAAATGPIRREHMAADGAGGDVFSYVLRDSRYVHADYRGRTFRAANSRELGLFQGGTTPVKGQITSLDVYLPSYDLDPDLTDQLPVDPIIYFSVTDATAAAVPGSWLGGGAPRSGATIFRRRWDSTTGQWTNGPPLHTPGSLGVPTTADIDALAYDQSANQIVISFTRATTPAGLSQLVFLEYCVDGTTLVDYKEKTDSGGTRKVVDSLDGSDEIEIVGTCGDDPTARQGGILMLGPRPFVQGTPTNNAFIDPIVGVDGVTYRSCDDLGNPTYSAHLVGLPGGVGPSVAVFVLVSPISGNLFVEARPTSPMTAMRGDPVSCEIVLPTPTLAGIRIQGGWVTLNVGAGTLALSPLIEMYL